jgi:NarL family two-component system response regulator LiaR
MEARTGGGEQRIRVVLVDDHEMVRRGLERFIALTPDVEVIAQANSGTEAVRLACELQPDVVLMDLVMDGLDGVAATRLIGQRAPEVKVLILTYSADDRLVSQALDAGALGILSKDVDCVNLAEAVRAAHAGRAAVATLTQHKTPLGRLRASGLSRRELQVLELMVRGLTNMQIAERLTISRATANVHVCSILGKLEVHSRTGAVAVALQNRLVA